MAAAIHTFWLSFPTLKVASTLPMMVYGVFVQMFWGSWWILNLNMRLGGDADSHGHRRPYNLAFLPNVGTGPRPMMSYGVMVKKILGPLVDC